MPTKTLLTNLETTRTIDGKSKRVRLVAGTVADLTDAEIAQLDILTKRTGKPHYREPVQEGGGKPKAAAPIIQHVDEYDGESVAIGAKTVAQLKAYLTYHEVSFDDNADQAALLKLADAQVAVSKDDDL